MTQLQLETESKSLAPNIVVRRVGKLVFVGLTCCDEYAAMLAFDAATLGQDGHAAPDRNLVKS